MQKAGYVSTTICSQIAFCEPHCSTKQPRCQGLFPQGWPAGARRGGAARCRERPSRCPSSWLSWDDGGAGAAPGARAHVRFQDTASTAWTKHEGPISRSNRGPTNNRELVRSRQQRQRVRLAENDRTNNFSPFLEPVVDCFHRSYHSRKLRLSRRSSRVLGAGLLNHPVRATWQAFATTGRPLRRGGNVSRAAQGKAGAGAQTRRG